MDAAIWRTLPGKAHERIPHRTERIADPGLIGLRAAPDLRFVYDDTVEYAGYVTVDVQSTSNTTYAGVVYDSIIVNYDHNVTLGTSGAASFPVLPGNIVVVVGNTDTNISDSVNATVTATYYY